METHNKCRCCDLLNSEEECMSITEIYIDTSGHYNFDAKIIYCPECGKRLDKYAKTKGAQV